MLNTIVIKELKLLIAFTLVMLNRDHTLIYEELNQTCTIQCRVFRYDTIKYIKKINYFFQNTNKM